MIYEIREYNEEEKHKLKAIAERKGKMTCPHLFIDTTFQFYEAG